MRYAGRLLVTVAITTVMLVGCDSSSAALMCQVVGGADCAAPSASPGAAGTTVQAAIEGAAGVKLLAQPIGAGAPPGVAMFSNTTTIATDLQVVMVIIADTEANAKAVADVVGPSLLVPGVTVKTYMNKNVVVVYGALPGGTDNSAAVEKAVNDL